MAAGPRTARLCGAEVPPARCATYAVLVTAALVLLAAGSSHAADPASVAAEAATCHATVVSPTADQPVFGRDLPVTVSLQQPQLSEDDDNEGGRYQLCVAMRSAARPLPRDDEAWWWSAPCVALAPGDTLSHIVLTSVHDVMLDEEAEVGEEEDNTDGVAAGEGGDAGAETTGDDARDAHGASDASDGAAAGIAAAGAGAAEQEGVVHMRVGAWLTQEHSQEPLSDCAPVTWVDVPFRLIDHHAHNVAATVAAAGGGLLRPPDTRPLVRDMYKWQPYPYRSSEEEKELYERGSIRAVMGVHPALISHEVFGGMRDFTDGSVFRILIVDGGNGDATLFAAQTFADLQYPYEVVQVDTSEQASRMARARADARRLSNVTIVDGDFTEVLADGSWGHFDYIFASDVMQHMDDPALGMHILARSLAPLGGMRVTLNAPAGRTGLDHVKEALRSVCGGMGGDDDGSELDVLNPAVDSHVSLAAAAGGGDGARDGPRWLYKCDNADRLKLLRDHVLVWLPESNWFRRNEALRMSPVIQGDWDDNGRIDAFLHTTDRTFTVREAAALAQGAGLRMLEFDGLRKSWRPEQGKIRVRHTPYAHGRDVPVVLRDRLDLRPSLDQASFMEAFRGDMRTHTFFAVRDTNPVQVPSRQKLRACSILCSPRFTNKIQQDSEVQIENSDELQLYGLNKIQTAAFQLVDCEHTLEEIWEVLAGDLMADSVYRHRELQEVSDFVDLIDSAYQTLRQLNLVHVNLVVCGDVDRAAAAAAAAKSEGGGDKRQGRKKRRRGRGAAEL